MPFKSNKFGSVVAKRVIHHFDPGIREQLMQEVARVLKPKGTFIILEGTPGIYRKTVKTIGFALGCLGEDEDIFGHLSVNELKELVKSQFEIKESRKLGSPLMPFSIFKSALSTKLFSLYRITNFLRWWTLVVAEKS